MGTGWGPQPLVGDPRLLPRGSFFGRAQAFQEFVRNYREGGGGDGRRGRAGSLLQYEPSGLGLSERRCLG